MTAFELIVICVTWLGIAFVAFSGRVRFSKIAFSIEEDGRAFFWSGFAWLTILASIGTAFIIFG